MAPRPEPAAVSLRRGALELQVLPAQGACCAALIHHAPGRAALHLLRPLPDGSQDLFESAAYVLVPYSNRLFGQRLLAGAGNVRQIARNRPGLADPVHGVGWMKAWSVTGHSPDRLTLASRHEADAHWPYTHACELQLAVDDSQACFRLTLRNLSETPMPVGLGFHPFLAIDDDSEVFFRTAGRWEQDAQGLPTRLAPSPYSPTQGLRAAALELNHCHSGWSGTLRLTRPRHGISVEMRASKELDHLQVYRRPGVPWLCAEPVSHATGAWSLPQVHHASAGLRWLPPGAEFQGWMAISVRSGPAGDIPA